MKTIFTSLFTLIVFCSAAQQPTKEQMKQIEDAKKVVKSMKGEQFPDFKLSTKEGEEFTSENTNGKIILFNFWFTSCGPCIKEMPELNELVQEFKDENVLFIAPTFNDKDQVDQFLKRFNFDYSIVSEVKDFCLELNIRSYPTHFIVNREGAIEKVMIGYSTTTVGSLRKSLKKLLKKS